jgi:hypothetical protein
MNVKTIVLPAWIVFLALWMASVLSGQVAQQSSGPNSPNIAGVNGDVSLATNGKAPASSATYKMALEDQYHLRALNAELNAIQAKIQQLIEAEKGQQKVQEQWAVLAKVCGQYKIAVKDCIADAETGEVKQKPEPPLPPASAPTPTAKPAK